MTNGNEAAMKLRHANRMGCRPVGALLGTVVTTVMLAIGCIPPPPVSDGGADCALDATCDQGQVPSPAPQVEIGFTDSTDDTYKVVDNGGAMPLFTALQGGSHIFVTLRAAGFPNATGGEASVVLAQRVTLLNGDLLHDFTQITRFTEIDGGFIELESRFVFLDALPEDIDGQTAILSFTLTAVEDESVVADLTQNVVLELVTE